jgi:hypothetical protein
MKRSPSTSSLRRAVAWVLAITLVTCSLVLWYALQLPASVTSQASQTAAAGNSTTAAPPPPPTVVDAKPPPSPPKKKACAADTLAAFPWPRPPEPSVVAVIPPYLMFSGESKAPTLAGVAARLEGTIARAGYREPKYLGAGCDGFAIVLDLEHINDDGSRKRGSAGFAPPSQDEAFSLTSYIKRLFYAPPGQYRQIVFVVSDQRMGQATEPATDAQLRAIARDGKSALPSAFESVSYTGEHVVQALIYEFEKGPQEGDARGIPPEGRLGATVHLRKARLF